MGILLFAACMLSACIVNALLSIYFLKRDKFFSAGLMAVSILCGALGFIILALGILGYAR